MRAGSLRAKAEKNARAVERCAFFDPISISRFFRAPRSCARRWVSIHVDTFRVLGAVPRGGERQLVGMGRTPTKFAPPGNGGVFIPRTVGPHLTEFTDFHHLAAYSVRRRARNRIGDVDPRTRGSSLAFRGMSAE